MTNKEFSAEMDVIYENINKGGAVGLDPYEKSVILTAAQEKLVMELSGTDLTLIANLVKTEEMLPVTTPLPKIDDRSTVYPLPVNYFALVNEVVVEYLTANPTPSQIVTYPVIPTSFAEYSMLMSKAYKYPKRRTALRLVNSGNATPYSNKYVEILCRVNKVLPNTQGTEKYRVSYVAQPTPIILETLTGDDSVRGLQAETPCILIASIHPLILEYAVTLAEKYYFDKYGNPPQQQQ